MSTLSVLDAAREDPARLALVDGASELTFGQLAERVRERMRRLAPLHEPGGAAAGLVGVATDESRSTIETLLALIELELPFFPIHSRATAAEREAALEALPISGLVDPDGADDVRVVKRVFRDSPHARRLLATTPHLAGLATSGSTGRPRVALLSRAAFLASARASAAHLGWHPGDRWLLCLPLAHVGGLSIITRCLSARKPVVLQPPRATGSSSERLAAAIVAGRATLLSLVPAQLDGLLELEPRFELPRAVRVILTGGAAASGRLLRAGADRGWPILTSYGLTEACSQVATQRPNTPHEEGRGVGVPLPGIEVRIEGGVIVIRGPTLASGYIGAGAEATIDVVAGFRTSDLGRIDAAGELHVLGRADDLIISGGENVAPAEIEAVLQTCSGVLEACVFGAPDPRWGQAVVAGLRTRRTDARALIAAVAAEARSRLAAFRRPKFYVCLSEFRYGKNGKLDRAATIAALSDELARDPERWRAPPG